jgi:hypothetical protein
MRAEERLSYRRIQRTIRPPRAVIGIPRVGDWQTAALHAVQVLSTTWGGAAHLLLPIASDGSFHEAFQPVLESYDADLWGNIASTNRAWRDAAPAQYETWLNATIEKNQANGLTEDGLRDHFSSDTTLDHYWEPWNIPEPTLEAIPKRTSPLLGYREQLRPSIFTFDSPPPSDHFVDAIDLDPLPPEAVLPGGSWMTPEIRLLLAARHGDLSPRRRTALEARGVKVVDLSTTPDDLSSILQWAWFAKTDESFRAIAEAYARASGEHPPASGLDEPSIADRRVFKVSEVGCTGWRRWSPKLDELPLVVVVGDTADDFAYAMALDRMNAPAVWLPRSALRSRRFAKVALPLLIRGLNSLERQGGGERPVTLVSLSEKRPQLLHLRQRLRSASLFDAFNVTVADVIDIPSDWPPVLADPVIIGEPLDEPFEGDTALRGIEPRRPTDVRSVRSPSHLRWWVDAEMPDHRMPTRSVLNSAVVARSAGWEAQARVNSFGVSYSSHTLGLVLAGSPDDHQLERPVLRQPEPDEIFRRLLEPGGYTLEESVVGGFHRQCAELWGGHARLEEDLTDPQKRRFLSTWIKDSDAGIRLKDRRYLTTQDIARHCRTPIVTVQQRIDEWLEMGIIRRGSCLRCDNCRFTGWYDADDAGQGFRCQRCRSTQAAVSSRFRPRPSEDGSWRYSMNEVVVQALTSNIELPVQVLRELRPRRGSMLWVPERTVFKDGNEVQEVDIWALIDGQIVLGEVTGSDTLEKTKRKEVERVHRLARLVNELTADQMVFATSARRWSARTLESVKLIEKQTGIHPTIMTAVGTRALKRSG